MRGGFIITRHTFIRQSKLTDVKGRIDYVTNPERQEHLYATCGAADVSFWKDLAAQNQLDYKKSGTAGKCIEARELIIALPESLMEYDPPELLKRFVDAFHDRFDVECIAGLHHNKAKTNYHIHLIYSERKALEERIVKTATRNMFYDETGHHVRTKKEILDENKQIRPGCVVIPKGEVYEMKMFGPKDSRFKSKKFLSEIKTVYTDLINSLVTEERERLEVFDPNGPYLPTKKIGKNNPRANEIKADNELRREWNLTVDDAVVAGVHEDDIIKLKDDKISAPIIESVKDVGYQPNLFQAVLSKAIQILMEMIMKLPVVKKKDIEADIEAFEEMKAVKRQLENVQKEMRIIGRKIEDNNKKLAEYSGLNGLTHRKKRRILENENSRLRLSYREKSEELEKVVHVAGYWTVAGFMKAYRKAESVVEDYLKGRKDSDSERKESVLDELNRIRNEQGSVPQKTIMNYDKEKFVDI